MTSIDVDVFVPSFFGLLQWNFSRVESTIMFWTDVKFQLEEKQYTQALKSGESSGWPLVGNEGINLYIGILGIHSLIPY